MQILDAVKNLFSYSLFFSYATIKNEMTKAEVKDRLKKHYPNGQITVDDLTGTENHYAVQIMDSQFKDLTPIERHKKVLNLFKEELKSGDIHALSLKIRHPLT